MFLIADTHVHLYCVSLCGSGTYPRPELRTAGGSGDFGCPVGVGGGLGPEGRLNSNNCDTLGDDGGYWEVCGGGGEG